MASGERDLDKREVQQRAEVLALPVLPLRRHGRLVAAQGGDALLSVSVGPAGEAVGLWAAAETDRVLMSTPVQSRGASLLHARAAHPAGTRITVQSSESVQVVRITESPRGYSTAQPLPGERFLAVAGRCQWRPDGPDCNALIYDPDGVVIAKHTFGDGIRDVGATPSGKIWVSYSDEGVYGSRGWGGPGPAPLGSCGVACFGLDGIQQWRFPRDDAAYIDGCYALNVCGETVWACYYSTFPVVRIADGDVTMWRNSLAHGAKSLLVDDRRIGMAGGYRVHRDRLVVAELGDTDLCDVGRYRLVLPEGQPLPEHIRMIGRGPDLHVFHDLDWYQVSLADTAVR
ncbi:hypothetical protein [Dactylosporangium sp. CA-139066]|uniref:hypothetical protein n=1 Tax=Dactylosporangium sp. CA-139066 TaxID=3239930 RepID=UPI003D926947